MFNVVNPDVIVEQYGADTLRLYEMFLGPVETSKPWDTKRYRWLFPILEKVLETVSARLKRQRAF